MGGSIERWLQQSGGPAQTPEVKKPGSISNWLEESNPAQRLRTSVDLSDPAKADSAARIKFLQEKTGLAPDLIARNPEEVSRRAVQSEFNPEKFATDFPHTASWLAESPENASIALEDLSHLSTIERTMRSIKRGFKIGSEEAAIGKAKYAEMANLPITDADRVRVAAMERDVRTVPGGLGFWNNLLYKTSKAMGQMFDSAPETVVGMTAGAGAGTIVAVGGAFLAAPLVLGGVALGGTLGFALSNFKSSAGQTYQDMKQIRSETGEPLDDHTAQMISLGVGGIVSGLDMVGYEGLIAPFKESGKKLFKEAAKDALTSPTMREALKNMGISYAQALGTEVTTEGLQEIVAVAGEEIAKLASGDNFKSSMSTPEGREAAVRRVGTAMSEAAQAMALMSLPGASIHGISTGYQARIAERNANYFKALGENIAESKTFERLPSAIQRIVREQTRGGPVENLYVPVEFWNEYWQKKGEDPGAMAERVTGNRSQWQEATETNGDVQIPTEKYATTIAPSEHNGAFTKELRRTPLEMSLSEATEAVKTEEAATTPSPEEQAATLERDQSADRVHAEVFKQLIDAGIDPKQAVDYSAIYRSVFRTMGERTGRTAEDLFKQYGLKIAKAEFDPKKMNVNDLMQKAHDIDTLLSNMRESSVDKVFDKGTFQSSEVDLITNNFPAWTVEDLRTEKTKLENVLADNGISGTRLHNMMLELEQGEWPKMREDPQGYILAHQVMKLRRVEIEQALREIGPLSGEFFQNKPVTVAERDRLIYVHQNRMDRILEDIGRTRLLESVNNDKVAEKAWLESHGRGSPRIIDEMHKAGFLSDQDVKDFKESSRIVNELRDYVPPKALPPGFYSQAERLIETKMPNRASLEDVRNILKDVKKEERKWLGLDEQLKYWEEEGGKDTEPSGKVTKEQVLDFLRANRLEIQEVQGATTRDEHAISEAMDVEINDIVDNLRSEFMEAVSNQKLEFEIAENGNIKVRRNIETLWMVDHNGERYAPILYDYLDRQLEMANDMKQADNVIAAQVDEESMINDELYSLINDRWGDTIYEEVSNDLEDFEGERQYEQYTLPGGENYQEFLFKLPELEGKYESPHFEGQGAVFATARTKDRVDVDGNKVLFVEEIQSDWHQAGRDRGYVGDINTTGWTAELVDDFWEVRNEKGETVDRAHNSRQGATSAEEAIRQAGTGEMSDFGGLVPDAPFRTTWHEFVFKAMLRKAAEQGYDSVAWTTGEQQNERYGLEKVADELEYVVHNPDAPIEEQTGTLRAYKHGALEAFRNIDGGRATVFNEDVPVSRLGDYIGKELAVKLMAKESSQVRRRAGEVLADIANINFDVASRIQNLRRTARNYAHTVLNDTLVPDSQRPELVKLIEEYVEAFDKWPGSRVLKGEEIKVGGQGMRGFYDDIMVRFVNKFVKKYGSTVKDTKVKTHELESGVPDYEDNGHIESMPGGFGQMVHSIHMTPELKRAALANEFALYQKRDWQIASLELEAIKSSMPTMGNANSDQGLANSLQSFYMDARNPVDLRADAMRYHMQNVMGIHDPIEDALSDKNLVSKVVEEIRADFGEDFDKYFPNADGDYNQGKGEPLGRIRLGDHVSIDLFKNADFSTFVHESGHFFLQMLDDATDETSKTDQATIRTWLGAEKEGPFTREQHEMFARGFERYLAEGRAPVSALQRVFFRFKTWMMAVYSSLRDLNVELTDEVRHVFDRLLASESDIKLEQTRQPPLFETLSELFDTEAGAKAKMSPEEAKSYTEAVERAHLAASEEMAARIMKDWQREQSQVLQAEREKVREGVVEEAAKNNVIKTRAFLESGTLPGGGALPEEESPFKLSTDDVRAAGFDLPSMMSRDPDNSLHPDMAADLLGFSSGEQLMHAMSNAEEPNKFIDSRVNAVMRGKKAQMQLLTATEAPSEAMKAVHNEKRAELLRKELQILATQDLPEVKGMVRRLARRIPMVKDVREQARAIVDAKEVRSISAQTYLRAEQTAARAAIEFFNKGDVAEAFNQKQRELLNHELFRAASDAQDFANKAAEYMRRFDRKEIRQRLGLAKGPYLAQIDAIRERFDFAKVSNKDISRRQSLREFLEEKQAEGLMPDIPDYVIDEAFHKNFRELTLEQLRGVYQSARQIEHLARVKNKLLASAQSRTLGQTVSDITTRIGKNFAIKNEPPDYSPSLMKRTKRALNRIDAGLTRMEFLFKYMDGHEANGPVWNALFKPIQEAENVEGAKFRVAQTALSGLFTNRYSKAERSLFWWKKYEVPELNTSFTKPTLLAIALNQGNQYNREALMEGHEKFGWTEAGIQAALNHLDRRDWDVVQGIWDHLESYWPEVTRLEKELTGLEPDKVKPEPVHTPFGEYRGGYYPIMFDKEVSWKQASIDAEERTKDLFGGAWVYAMTKHGHTKERVGTGGKPLLLNLSPLVNHVSNVVHDLSFRRAIIDINRLITTPEVRQSIEGAVGREMYRELHPWLVAIAREKRGEYANAMEHLIARARTGSTIVQLGWRLGTAVQDVANFSSVVKEIGVKYTLRGVADIFANPTKVRRAYRNVIDQSPYMKERFEVFDRDVRDMMKRMNLSDVATGPLTVMNPYVHPAAIRNSFFQFMHMSLMAVSLPTWSGAFRRAMDGKVEGILSGDAVAARDFADSLVRETSSAGAIKDLASLQRGSEAWRTFTMFYTYFGAVYNQMKKTGQEYKLHKDMGKLVAGAMWTWFLPAIVSELVLGRGPDDRDDPTEWAKWAARTEIKWPLSTVLLLRDLAYPIIEGKGDYRVSAAFDIPKTLIRVSQAMTKRITEDLEFTRKNWEDIANTAGYFLELPTKQVWHSLESIFDFMTGEKQIEGPLDIYKSLISSNPQPGAKIAS